MQNELQTLSTWRNKLFGGSKTKSKIKDMESRLNLSDEHLKEKELLKQELSGKISKIEKELQVLRSELQDFTFKGYEEVRDGYLVITDKSVNNSKSRQKAVAKNISLEDKKEYVMVHSTDFFPKDNRILCNYDGNKVGKVIMEYQGVRKEVKALSHRHTTHYTLNNIVTSTGDGRGVWEQPKYIVVEPFYLHQDQFINGGVNDNYVSGDNWIWGSVDLKKPYYLVREDALDEIPSKEKYNIIIYRGEAGVCLQRFLKMLDYPIFGYEPNDPVHANSIEMSQEDNCNIRDMAVNFVLNNSFDGKETREFSLDDIKKIIDVRLNFSLYYEVPEDMSSDLNIPTDFINVVVSSGICLNANGKFYFDTDQNIYETLCDPNKIDVDNLQRVWEAYRSLEQTEFKTDGLSLKEIGKMTVADIFLFENFVMCKAFFEQIELLISQFSHTLSEGKLYFYPYIAEDGFYLELMPSDPSFYETIKVADNEDTLEEAYTKTLEYLSSLEYTKNSVPGRGSMNILYLFLVISIIILGMFIAWILHSM